MLEKLLTILRDIRPDVDFERESGLICKGLLDSIEIVTIMSEISREFNIELTPNDLTVENFNSAQAMVALIERCKR